MSLKLDIDRIACTGHALCADLFPERIQLDEWGYPIIDENVPAGLAGHARRAVRACPTLALKLSRVSRGAGQPRQQRSAAEHHRAGERVSR